MCIKHRRSQSHALFLTALNQFSSGNSKVFQFSGLENLQTFEVQ